MSNVIKIGFARRRDRGRSNRSRNVLKLSNGRRRRSRRRNGSCVKKRKRLPIRSKNREELLIIRTELRLSKKRTSTKMATNRNSITA